MSVYFIARFINARNIDSSRSAVKGNQPLRTALTQRELNSCENIKNAAYFFMRLRVERSAKNLVVCSSILFLR